MRRLLVTVLLAALAPAVFEAQVPGQQSEWISWARDHHHPIASLVSPSKDTFGDLQFFKELLEGRRIVQLGESGHGVAEFNQAKVRLIKFFHEQMGFDVIAFESSIYECYAANAHVGTAKQMLSSSIFGVWATEEVEPLFAYIKETQKTARPLVLAGFDTQLSSAAANTRPAFFRRVLSVVDAGYAEQVEVFDANFIVRVRTGGGSAYAKAEEARLIEFYEGLEAFLQDHSGQISAAFPGDPSPRIAERAAWSMVRFIRQLVASVDRPTDITVTGGMGIRDKGMADNLAYLATELYPDKKILMWAHNFHIRHANALSSSRYPTMGSWTVERFRSELYTIGLYMNRGRAAYNDRTIYVINPQAPGGMEYTLSSIGAPNVFIDLLRQSSEPGNSWMFSETATRDWGVNNVQMIPRDQYDGILLVDLVAPPAYLTF